MLKKYVNGFFSSLSSSIEKRRIMTEVEHVFKELEDSTIKQYSRLSPDFKRVESYDEIRRGIKSEEVDLRRMSLQEGILAIARKLVDDKDDIEDMIDESFKNVIIREAMDYHEVNILIYVGAMRTFNDFARYLATALIAGERQELGYRMKGYDKEAVEYVNDEANIESFQKTFEALSRPFDDFMKALKDLKGIKADEDFNERAVGLRANATDPMRMGFLPPRLHPFVLLGRIWNDLVASSYESAKVEAERIQIDLMLIEQAKATGEADDSLTEQSEYLAKRLAKLKAKQRQIEESVE